MPAQFRLADATSTLQLAAFNFVAAVPFALAGGAIAGPMGAFMALPVAAMITALIKNTGRRYDVVYQTKYDADQIPTAPAGTGNGAPS